MKPVTLMAVLTSHNRRDLTIQALADAQASAAKASVDLRAVLVDDGSSDGTATAVRERFPWVDVQAGDGHLFWNRGMHRAIERASSEDFDYLLWLNDDTRLQEDALARLLLTSEEVAERTGREGIVVGATKDPKTGQLTYSGVVANRRLRPFDFRKVFSATEALACDTMNGNCVLIPLQVLRQVGNLDPAFEHSMGDIDYGLRARRAGVPIVVAAGFVGECEGNLTLGGYLDPRRRWNERWRIFTGRKVLPPASWKRLTQRHGGMLWPFYFLLPYASFAIKALWRRSA